MRRVALLMVGMMVMACGDANGPESTIVGIEVPNLRWYLELGDSARFKAVTRNALAEPVEGAVQWTSSNPAVVSIDQKGLAVAHALGAAEIQVSAKRAAGMGWRLSVVTPIARIAVEPDSLTLVPGDKALLAATLVDASGAAVSDERSITDVSYQATWSSGDARIARMGPDSQMTTAPNLLTGLQAGQTRVRAQMLSDTGSALVTVHSLELAGPAAGGDFACALGTDSLPYCWGAISSFLRPPPGLWPGPAYVPHTSPQSPKLTSLAAGQEHACGLTTDGQAYCWGSNEFGALGTGTEGQPYGVVAVSGGLRFSSITAGGGFTCGIAESGQVHCWGIVPGLDTQTVKGRCGTEGKYSTARPCSRTPLPAGNGAVPLAAISAGARHVCGLDAAGLAYCWGALGSPAESVPAPVDGAQRFTQLSSGDGFTCGLGSTGLAYCWGPGSWAATDSSADRPVAVDGGLTFSHLSAGYASYPFVTPEAPHVCGLSPEGAVYCWGSNASGQLGSFSELAQVTSPVRAATGLTFRSVSAGGSHTCGRATQGVVYCWGGNWVGQLGTPGTTSRWEPQPVTGQHP